MPPAHDHGGCGDGVRFIALVVRQQPAGIAEPGQDALEWQAAAVVRLQQSR
jgi:hypothetical protein